MNQPPVISVLMPVYNAERYLAAAVESILTQSFEDFEFHIVDDGSTDDSLAILRQYASCDSRIRLTSRPRTGYVVALNEMLAEARGTLVARMDADDIALPDRLAAQIHFMDEHPEVVCVGGGYQIIDERGDRLIELFPPQSNEDCQRSALRGKSPISHPCAMYRKSIVEQCGAYDPMMCPAEDLDLWLRIGERGQLANLPRVILKYRLHGNSVSAKQQKTQLAMTQLSCQNAWKRRGIVGACECEPWRPDETTASRIRHYLQCGWWAWSSREEKTAARYGAKVLKLRPMSKAGWVLIGAALRQSLRRQVANR